MFFTKNANNEVYLEKAGGDLSKSKLRTGYIIVPLGVQYNFSKLKNAGMDVQYRRFYNGFKIGANVYGGVRMSTNNIIEGNDGELRNREIIR
jgi:outer membrane protein W